MVLRVIYYSKSARIEHNPLIHVQYYRWDRVDHEIVEQRNPDGISKYTRTTIIFMFHENKIIVSISVDFGQ